MTTGGVSPPSEDSGLKLPKELLVGDVLSVLANSWRAGLVAAFIGAMLGGLGGILRPKNYLARASFIPEQSKLSNLPSGLGALATQFGLDVAGDAGRSPQFYRELVTTPGLLRSVLDTVVPLASAESAS